MSLRTSSFSLLIAVLIADYQCFGQSVVKNYFSVNTGISVPLGKFASSDYVNTTGLLTAFATPTNDNSGSSLFIPATSSQQFSAEGAYYFYKFLGVAAYGAYADMNADVSVVKNALDQVVKQGSGIILSQFSNQQLMKFATISAKTNHTNWKLATFLVGPTLSHNSGKFTFDFKVLAGIMNVTTPEVKADIDFSALFIGGTILRFQQAAISKAIFAYQVGYSVRYSLTDYLSVRLYSDYTSSANASFDCTVTTESPSINQIQALLSASGQQPLAVVFPQPQKTSVNLAISNLNVGIGVCYEFGSLAKKKKVEVEEDMELQKQK